MQSLLMECDQEIIQKSKQAEKNSRKARLSQEEESSLALAWREEESIEARERLVEANMGLVVAIARRYRASGVSLDELIAEGNLGLLRAVDGFDPTCGARFSTYAAYWIRQGISRAFAANSPRGRLGSRDRRDVIALEKAMRQHYSASGEQPTVAELAAALEWTTERVCACTALSRSFVRPFSIDEPQKDSERRAMQPAAPEANAPITNQEELASDIDKLLEDLTPVERAALEMRFGLHGAEPQGVDSIAESLDCTRRETRVAMRMAMAKLARKCKGSRMSGSCGEESVGDPAWEGMGGAK